MYIRLAIGNTVRLIGIRKLTQAYNESRCQRYVSGRCSLGKKRKKEISNEI